MNDAALATALEEVRALVRADGGDLLLTGVADDVVDLQLVIAGSECAECVMPRAFLEQVALDVLRRGGAAARAVRIDDPREG